MKLELSALDKLNVKGGAGKGAENPFVTRVEGRKEL
jgi:hypothetical protein